MGLQPDIATARPSKPGTLVDLRLLIGLVFVVVVLIFAALILVGATTEQGKTAEWVAHSRDVREQVHQFVSSLSDAENGRRGYVLTGQHRYLAHYTNGLVRAENALADLRRLTATNAVQVRVCDTLEEQMHLRRRVFTNSIAARQERGLDVQEQTTFLKEGQAAMELIREQAARMAANETARLDEQRAAQSKHVQGAVGFAVLVSLTGLVLFSVLLVLIARANRRRRDAEQGLRQTNQELEQRVGQRTAELEAANEEVQRVNAGLEARVQERTRQLEDAIKELEAFSYSVSHDLRAPLRHIQGYAEMLQRAAAGQLSEKASRFLQIIIDAGTDMGRLIDDLLDFSRVGREELRRHPVPLDNLAQDVIRELEMSVKDRQINWKIAPLPVVVGDATALRQVLANLIGNAVKYTGQRAVAEIEIDRNGDEEGMAVLYVRDNGAGFDMAYSDKLFGVFQRLHRADEFEGTGIGLATVRRIVARHGGRTWAEGVPDQGATFYFTLKPAGTDTPPQSSP